MPDGTTAQTETSVPVKAPLIDGPPGGAPQSPGRPAAQPTEITGTTIPERVKQSEVVEGGSPNLEIWLDPTAQKLVTERLINRLQTVNALSGKERPLTTIDRLIQKLGPEAIVRLEKGDLTREDLAIAVFVLRDELLQKSLAAGKLIKDVKKIEATRVGNIPFFRRIVENTSLQTQLEASKQLSSQYTREIGFDQWTQDRIENDLTALNQLRTSVELSFYGRHLDDPLFDQDSISLYTAGRKTGNSLHDAVVDELMGPEGVLTQRFGGKTFLELSQEDPIAATQALFEANQQALTQFAGEIGKNLLEAEKPDVDTTAIKTYAERFSKPASPESIKNLQENATRADVSLTEERTRLDALKTEKTNKESALEQLELTSLIAKRLFDHNEPRLQQDIDAYKAELNTYAAGSEDYNRVNTRLQASINELKQLDDEFSRAEATFTQTKDRVQTLPNLIVQQENSLKEKIAAKNQADRDLKQAQESFLDKDKATATVKWMGVLEKYSTIIDQRFSQKYGDEFTRERLADPKERPDGQIEGAERIREHIFRLVLENKADYDPELARKMLTDETIARAIIWVYKIDMQKSVDSTGTNLATSLWQLQLRKDTLLTTKNALDKTPVNQTRKRSDLQKGIVQNESEIRNAEKQLSQTVLPYLNSSQFQAGDLLRFMIHEGLKSAEQGNPYLTLDEYYATPKPELKLEAESIYREGIGETVMKDNQMVWEGRVVNAMNPFTFPTIVPQHYSVGLGITRDIVNYNLYTKTDRDFLELLPDTFDPALPDSVKVFYDDSGKLSADKPGIPEWIRVYDGTEITTEDMLNSLGGMISTEFSKLMTSAVADYFLKRPQQERLQMLRGFRTVENINDVALAENSTDLHNYQIRFDNSGNFFIRDITNPALPKEHELSSFFQKRLKDFKGSKLTLSQEGRKTLQQEFLKILSPLGREILRAQQRR